MFVAGDGHPLTEVTTMCTGGSIPGIIGGEIPTLTEGGEIPVI